jgi:hypothetical protein
VSERDILVRVVLISLVALAAAWFGLVGPKRSDAGKQTERVTAAQQKLNDAQQQLTAGRQAEAQGPENARVLAGLRAALPDSAGAAALLRELNGTSNHDSVAFRTASIAAGSSSSSSTPTTGTDASSDLPPGATIGPNNLPVLGLSLTFDGRYLHLTSLLDRLRSLVGVQGDKVTATGRLLSVEGFQLTRGTESSATVSASLAATAYLAPVPGSATTTPGTATPGAPSATGTASSSSPTTTTASAGGVR